MSGTFMTADQHLAAVENFRKRIAELEYNLGMSRGNVDDLRKIRDEKDKRIAFLESEVEKYQAMTRREKTEYHKMAERIEG